LAAHWPEGRGRAPEGLAPVVARVADLTAGAGARVTTRPGDARSGSTFERVEIDGARYFLKVVSYSGDWLMRVTGDRDHRTFKLWRSGLMDRTRPWIDHTVVAMALEGTGPGSTRAGGSTSSWASAGSPSWRRSAGEKALGDDDELG
jgi:hypothetical protein